MSKYLPLYTGKVVSRNTSGSYEWYTVKQESQSHAFKMMCMVNSENVAHNKCLSVTANARETYSTAGDQRAIGEISNPTESIIVRIGDC